MTNPNPHYYTSKGYIKWDNQLLKNLAQASGKDPYSLMHSIKSLATALGVELPKWTEMKAEVNV